MIKIDCGLGFFIVPFDSVCVNGIYIERLNAWEPEGFTGPYAILMPERGAAMGEDGHHPFRYKTIEEAQDDVKTLKKYHTPQLPIEFCDGDRVVMRLEKDIGSRTWTATIPEFKFEVSGDAMPISMYVITTKLQEILNRVEKASVKYFESVGAAGK